MSLLEQIRNKVNEKVNREGVCKTCGNLEQIKENLIGCTELDKLILPKFPPYHRNCKCDNWEKRGD